MTQLQSIELEVDQLAEFLFKKNLNNAVIELSLGGIEDNKDMFYFCLDVFCKGLVMMFGKDNRLVVNDITLDQFDLVKQKMKNAGIDVTLDVIQRGDAPNTDNIKDAADERCPLKDVPEDLPEETLYPNVNMRHIEYLPHDLPLRSYHFEINLNSYLSYFISFSLFHKTV